MYRSLEDSGSGSFFLEEIGLPLPVHIIRFHVVLKRSSSLISSWQPEQACQASV